MIQSLDEISELAEFIAEENFSRGSVNLDKISDKEGIYVCPGSYGNCFTGMLRYTNKEFQIFLNLDKLNSIKYARSRFTYAHELGHYFIDQHRNTLKAGHSLSYDKVLTHFTNHLVEKEANHFATNLLMPKSKFMLDAAKYNIGIETIRLLAKKYKTSLTCTALQYRNLVEHPCSLLFWNKNRDFRTKNYSESWFNMVRPISHNFNLKEQVITDIFEDFNGYFTPNTSLISSSLSAFYPDISLNSRNDKPVKIETLNLQSFGFLSLVYINQ